MAIDMGTETLAISKQERTWRVELFAEKGEDPTLRAHREIVTIDAGGNIVARERTILPVERSLSAIASQSFTVAAKSYTGAELADVVAGVVDVLRQQDIVAAQG